MKKLSIVFTAVLLVFCLTGCNSSKQTEIYSQAVKYNLIRYDSPNKFSFNVNVVSDKNKPEVEFISAEGENTDYLNVTFTNDTFDDIKNKKFDGKYFTLLGVHCVAMSKYTKIESMKLKVDGVETVVKFPTPIENTSALINDIKHCLSQRHMPIYIFPQTFVGRGEQDYTFSVSAMEDITVKSFRFKDFLAPEDMQVYVNEELVGSGADVFPLELKKGDSLGVCCKIKMNKANLTGKENFYTNIIFDCVCDGEEITEYYPLSAVFIGNIDDAKEFVDFYK